jgi:hypothetical protein
MLIQIRRRMSVFMGFFSLDCLKELFFNCFENTLSIRSSVYSLKPLKKSFSCERKFSDAEDAKCEEISFANIF